MALEERGATYPDPVRGNWGGGTSQRITNGKGKGVYLPPRHDPLVSAPQRLKGDIFVPTVTVTATTASAQPQQRSLCTWRLSLSLPLPLPLPFSAHHPCPRLTESTNTQPHPHPHPQLRLVRPRTTPTGFQIQQPVSPPRSPLLGRGVSAPRLVWEVCNGMDGCGWGVWK